MGSYFFAHGRSKGFTVNDLRSHFYLSVIAKGGPRRDRLDVF